MKIYAFEYCSCIYESTFGIESLHLTKRGAYKAMRSFILKKWGVDFDTFEVYGKQQRRDWIKRGIMNNHQWDGKYEFMRDERTRIKEYDVED
jgi:hypothetical protein